MRPCSYPPQVFGLAVVAVAVLTSSLRAQQGPPPAIRTAHGDWYWERGPADLVLEHGKIVTVDSAQPRAEALAIRDHRILAVGSDAAIQRFVGPDTKVVDLRGRLAIPGFIDAHAHFMGLGESLKQLDLMGVPTWSDIVAKVAEAARKAEPGEWILGQGWHQAKWEHPPHPNVEGLPLHASLDSVSPDNPVLLEHASGHASFVNGKALELAGITDATPSPEGGEIVRDANGHAIGMLRDNAQGLVRRVYQRDLDRRTPEQVRADMAETVRLASHDAVSTGVTGFDDQGESFATLDFLKQQVAAGKVPIRLYVEVESMSPDSLARHLPDHWLVGYGDDHLTVRAVGEVLSDGALGTHSAWFLKPYADLPSTSGLNVTPIARIRGEAEVALRNGFQVTVHAIGDRANREVLDTFQQIFAGAPRSEGPPLEDRARPAPGPRRHPPVRRDARDRLHADTARLLRRPLRGDTTGRGAGEGWRLRVAEAHGRGRHHRQWHRRPGGAAGPDPQLLLRGHAQAVEREALLPRREDDP